jgi:hypothetical protein
VAEQLAASQEGFSSLELVTLIIIIIIIGKAVPVTGREGP